jgi:flavin reductase (DIM6/NTAB) family NADH-FMN oxidoreductase RutF
MNRSADTGPGAAALRELVMPVVVVAVSDGDETSCATSTCYVSLSPPVLCVSLAPAARTARLAVRTGKSAVTWAPGSRSRRPPPTDTRFDRASHRWNAGRAQPR